MSDDVVIRVQGLWKRYGLPLPVFIQTARRRIRAWRRKKNPQSTENLWALRDVTFEVKRGETLGIIGRNGAGKSTLLKILAGVTPPTRGRVEVKGRIFPMIELNAGIHPELTGRENVRLLGAIMGLPRREIDVKMPEIEEFCELGEWFDRPVRMYSSGMLARLGFGVAMNVDADILLIDEVLAVGDLAFQQKCFSRLERLRRSGVTVLFVSHRLRQLERLSHRMIYLDSGSLRAQGTPMDIIHLYQVATDRKMGEQTSTTFSGSNVQATGEIDILKVDFLDATGRPTTVFSTGTPMTLRIAYRSSVSLRRFNLSVRFNSSDLICVSGKSVLVEGPLPPGEGILDIHLERLPFLRGVYGIDIGFKDPYGRTMYLGENIGTFQVQYTPEIHGDMGLVKTDWTVSVAHLKPDGLR